MTFKNHSAEVYSVVSLGNNLIASGGKNKNIFIWHGSNGTILRTLTGHSESLRILTSF
jgi:WD40 repeat protein